MDFTFEERNRGIYLNGATGMGKSTLMKTLAYQDMLDGHGLIFIDPHGPDCLDLLNNVPPERTEDVCYLDLSDTQYSVGLSLPIEPIHLVQTLKDIWDEVLSDRAQWFLFNGLQLLKDNPCHNLSVLKRLYYDASFRNELLANTTNPSILEFWGPEIASMSKNTIADAPQTIHNKIGQFLAIETIGACLTQQNPALNLEYAIKNRKIVVINLCKGVIGDSPASLFGSLIISHIRTILMKGGVTDCRLFIDEFQNFGSNVFASMLAECRKFGLCATLANQFLHQLRDINQSAIIATVGTIICFRTNPPDAAILNPYFIDQGESNFNATALVNLTPYQARVRRLSTQPETLHVTPLPETHQGSLATVLDRSRRRFAHPFSKLAPAPRASRHADALRP